MHFFHAEKNARTHALIYRLYYSHQTREEDERTDTRTLTNPKQRTLPPNPKSERCRWLPFWGVREEATSEKKLMREPENFWLAFRSKKHKSEEECFFTV